MIQEKTLFYSKKSIGYRSFWSLEIFSLLTICNLYMMNYGYLKGIKFNIQVTEHQGIFLRDWLKAILFGKIRILMLRRRTFQILKTL